MKVLICVCNSQFFSVRDNNDDMGYFGSSNKSVMYIASDDYVAANSREVSIKKGDKVTSELLLILQLVRIQSTVKY